MSLKTWANEFYHVDADCVKPEDAIDHSIQKWVGLRQANLDKHGVEKVRCYGELVDIKYGDKFLVSSGTCALCQVYLRAEGRCNACPLALVRQGIPCDTQLGGEGQAPYGFWVNYGDPEPMIRWLTHAKEMAK